MNAKLLPLLVSLSALAPLPQAVQAQASRGPALKAQTPVTLNFVNADIEAVTRAMGAMMEDRKSVV